MKIGHEIGSKCLTFFPHWKIMLLHTSLVRQKMFISSSRWCIEWWSAQIHVRNRSLGAWTQVCLLERTHLETQTAYTPSRVKCRIDQRLQIWRPKMFIHLSPISDLILRWQIYYYAALCWRQELVHMWCYIRSHFSVLLWNRHALMCIADKLW